MNPLWQSACDLENLSSSVTSTDTQDRRCLPVKWEGFWKAKKPLCHSLTESLSITDSLSQSLYHSVCVIDSVKVR